MGFKGLAMSRVKGFRAGFSNGFVFAVVLVGFLNYFGGALLGVFVVGYNCRPLFHESPATILMPEPVSVLPTQPLIQP